TNRGRGRARTSRKAPAARPVNARGHAPMDARPVPLESDYRVRPPMPTMKSRQTMDHAPIPHRFHWRAAFPPNEGCCLRATPVQHRGNGAEARAGSVATTYTLLSQRIPDAV